MKKFQLEFTEIAEQNLLDIREYIALDSERNADLFLGELNNKIHSILDIPYSGVAKDEVRKGARCIFHGRYNIYYEIQDDVVLILSILHGSREIKDLF